MGPTGGSDVNVCEELRKLDSLHTSVSDMVEERFAEELDFGGGGDAPRKRGRPRKIR